MNDIIMETWHLNDNERFRLIMKNHEERIKELEKMLRNRAKSEVS